MADSGPGRDFSIGRNGRSFTNLGLWKSPTFSLQRTDTMTTFWKLKMRGKTDDLPQDWWVASTAFPLIAATIGPLANVLSIASLATPWRVKLLDNGKLPLGVDDSDLYIDDPHWELILNALSLACGILGNAALLMNFTKRVRYIVALPLTIIAWYFATIILIAITVALNKYGAPIRPGQTYTQGFWHAILAATLYCIGSIILSVNMLGYFLGHYPQHFDLDDDQRTLILQTMMFFIWLGGGAAVFMKVCGMTYVDALYFCDVTVLTIGFGDFVATNTAGRGIILPYSVIGIIFLGLMVNSIRKFAIGMSKDKVIKKHQLNMRAQTFGRSVSTEKELRERLGLPPRRDSGSRRPSGIRKQSHATSMGARRASLEQYGHFDIHGRTITFHENKHKDKGHDHTHSGNHDKRASRRARIGIDKHTSRGEKLIILREEKDRFEAMREIQSNTSKFKQYYALSMSALAFGILWCLGAVVFWYAEARIQQLTYFEALYFCYVSLLTIGYGDFSPKSNAGKPFFIVWSLVAIPTMTILISDMSDTVVSAINRGTFTLADWTVMPKEGVWREFLDSHPKLKDWLQRKTEDREAQKRIERGFQINDPDEEAAADLADEDPESGGKAMPPTLEKLAEEPPEVTEHELARKLALAIKRTANDLRAAYPKKYSYEEWVEFTRLIRFSSKSAEEVEEEEEEEGLLEWDWIGEDSPMLADVSESEWILDRLYESLNRYTRNQAKEAKERERFAHTKRHEQKPATTHPNAIGPSQYVHGNDNYKDEHVHYPAHPGPRDPHASRYRDLPIKDLKGRPVRLPVSHAPVSEPLASHPSIPEWTSSESTVSKTENEDEEDEDIRKERAVEFMDNEERNGGTSVSGASGESGQVGAALLSSNDEGKDLERELTSPEVQHWATRIDSRGNGPMESPKPSPTQVRDFS